MAIDLTQQEAMEYVPRPLGLAGVSGVFAVYVEGDSMFPRFKSGDLVFVNPARQPTPGCDVIVEIAPSRGEAAGPAYIKRLLRRTAETVVLRQFNPPPGEPEVFELDRRRIRNLWRVLTEAELIGQ